MEIGESVYGRMIVKFLGDFGTSFSICNFVTALLVGVLAFVSLMVLTMSRA